MTKTTYIIEIPEEITTLVGIQNIRGALELETILMFKKTFHPDIVEKIVVTKPRTKKNGEENG